MKKNILYILFFGGIFYSCASVNGKKLKPEAYMNWYNQADNQCSFSAVEKDVSYAIKFKPYSHEVAKCAVKKCQPLDTIKSYLRSSNDRTVFDLKIELPSSNMFVYNSSGQITKEQRMEYFSFGFKNDIFLITNSLDTIDCQLAYYERTPPEFPIGRFELVFPFIDPSNIKEIKLFNKAVSNLPVSIQIGGIDNKDIPKLRL